MVYAMDPNNSIIKSLWCISSGNGGSNKYHNMFLAEE